MSMVETHHAKNLIDICMSIYAEHIADILSVGAANWGIVRAGATLMGAIHTNGAAAPAMGGC